MSHWSFRALEFWNFIKYFKESKDLRARKIKNLLTFILTLFISINLVGSFAFAASKDAEFHFNKAVFDYHNNDYEFERFVSTLISFQFLQFHSLPGGVLSEIWVVWGGARVKVTSHSGRNKWRVGWERKRSKVVRFFVNNNENMSDITNEGYVL